ncbi:baseplate J/gp47 family protein [Mycetohabitans rhizoxinica]|uniref:baseplate J/gp47 family protein n=1 Tax=Mycetohabitans rhizoxinica TaxID=412963 RepID=UPI0030CEECF1
MTDNYDYLTRTGVIVPDTAGVLDTVRNEWRGVLGDDLSVADETPQGVLITADALGRSSVIRNNAALANQINPNEAGGVFLDALCALTGLERAKAQRSSIADVEVTGIPNTVIRQGLRARTEAGELFETTETVVLARDGRAKVGFRAVEYGPVAAPAGTLRYIVDSVLGWETVHNPENAKLGRGRQSDASLRRLRKQTLALQGVSLCEAITSALYATEGVQSLKFRENTESVVQVIDGVVMKPHSIWVCIDGGTDADIAQALLKNKSAGAGWNGTVQVNAVDPASGQSYRVRFDRPIRRDFLARVTVRAASSVADPQIAVRDAILAYSEKRIEGETGFTVGTSVSPFELAAAVNRYVPGLYVQRLEVSHLLPINYVTTEIPLGIWEKAAIAPSGIQVIVV